MYRLVSYILLQKPQQYLGRVWEQKSCLLFTNTTYFLKKVFHFKEEYWQPIFVSVKFHE